MSDGQPAPVRDAATVVLLRDGTDGVEAWLLTRVAQLAFAAGMSVFPGGRVEEPDAALPLAGADLHALAERFGCPQHVAHALVGAAARETFEETGVLLAEPTLDLSDARADVEAGRRAFGDLLAAHDVSIDASALRPWARWVTPPGEPRRYDTRFFVAALPPAAVARSGTTEASAVGWLTPAAAIAQAQAGERLLLPPTLVTLASLRAFDTVAEVLAASDAVDLEPVHPTPVRGEDGTPSVRLPDGTVVPVPKPLRPPATSS